MLGFIFISWRTESHFPVKIFCSHSISLAMIVELLWEVPLLISEKIPSVLLLFLLLLLVSHSLFFVLSGDKNANACLGFGLACHLGVLSNLPTVGIGKNVSLNFLFCWMLKWYISGKRFLEEHVGFINKEEKVWRGKEFATIKRTRVL